MSVRAHDGMARRLHPVGGAVALLAAVVLVGESVVAAIAGVEHLSAGLDRVSIGASLVLVLALGGVALSGSRTAGNRASRLIARKRRRMPAVAVAGSVLIGVQAVTIGTTSRVGDDLAWHAVAIVAGVALLVPLAASALDGLRLAGRLRRTFGAHRLASADQRERS